MEGKGEEAEIGKKHRKKHFAMTGT